MISPVRFNFDKATWKHHGQGDVLQDNLKSAILWWVSIYTVHPCLDYVTIVWIYGQSNASDDGEDLSNYHAV